MGKITLAVCSYLHPENRGLKRAIDGLIVGLRRWLGVRERMEGGARCYELREEVGGHYAKCHRMARPYRKNEQAFVESFHRTLRTE